ncbi:MAG: hypothetical protein ACKVZJ_08875 [Phycisphaerales bacterium]
MTLRELGIVPVFPPREDFVVGDVFVSVEDPEGPDVRKIFETEWEKLSPADREKRLAMGMSSRLSRLPVLPNVANEYERTLAAPATGAEYNDILGNPALAAVNEKITSAEAALQAAKDIVKGPEAAVAAAATALRDAKHAVEDAETEVKRATIALNEAKGKPADPARIQQLEQAVGTKRTALRDAEKELLAAQQANELTPDQPADKKADARLRVTKAQHAEAVAKVELRQADEDLAAAKAAKFDIAALEDQLAKANNKLTRAKDEETKATRDDADAKESLAKAQSRSTDAQQKVKTRIDELKATAAAIEKAGVKLLYSQPRDAEHNVYTLAPLDPKGADALKNARVNRLRLVGFPEFATASFTQGDLSALIPIEAFSLGLNVSASQVNRVSVKVPAAESYGISTENIIPIIADEVTVNGERRWKLKESLVNASRFRLQPSTTDTTKAYFRVVTEVYYARALDVSVFASNSFGVRAQLAAPIPTAPAASASAPQNPQPEEPSEQPGSLDSFKQPDIDTSGLRSPEGVRALESIKQRIGTTTSVPGGQMQLVSYNEKSVGLRRIWDRPVAIGFRGLTIKVNLDTFIIESVQVTSSARPEGVAK